MVRDKERAVPAALGFLLYIDVILIYYHSIDVNISLKTEPWIRPDPTPKRKFHHQDTENTKVGRQRLMQGSHDHHKRMQQKRVLLSV